MGIHSRFPTKSNWGNQIKFDYFLLIVYNILIQNIFLGNRFMFTRKINLYLNKNKIIIKSNQVLLNLISIRQLYIPYFWALFQAGFLNGNSGKFLNISKGSNWNFIYFANLILQYPYCYRFCQGLVNFGLFFIVI